MRKLAIGLFAAAIIVLLGWAYYGAFCLFPGRDPAAVLDHKFVGAAYAVTWAIQLGYLAWLGCKWRAQKRDAARTEDNPR
jgi:hypothetical protein